MTSKILFDHLPKAGGTSVLRFLQAATGQRVPHIRGSSVTVRYRLKTLDAVAGHFTGRVLFPGVSTITVLRDPVERFLSGFFYYRDTIAPREIAHGRLPWMAPDATLEAFVPAEGEPVHAFLDNPLTCHLSAASGRPADRRDTITGAERNLALYAVVGFTDDLPSFLRACCDRFGWAMPPGEFHERRNDARPRTASPEVMDRIRKCLALDIELYSRLTQARSG